MIVQDHHHDSEHQRCDISNPCTDEPETKGAMRNKVPCWIEMIFDRGSRFDWGRRKRRGRVAFVGNLARCMIVRARFVNAVEAEQESEENAGDNDIAETWTWG